MENIFCRCTIDLFYHILFLLYRFAKTAWGRSTDWDRAVKLWGHNPDHLAKMCKNRFWPFVCGKKSSHLLRTKSKMFLDWRGLLCMTSFIIIFILSVKAWVDTISPSHHQWNTRRGLLWGTGRGLRSLKVILGV